MGQEAGIMIMIKNGYFLIIIYKLSHKYDLLKQTKMKYTLPIEVKYRNGVKITTTTIAEPAKGSFQPIWLKNEYGDSVAKCPICGNTSGSLVEELTHNYDCANICKSIKK